MHPEPYLDHLVFVKQGVGCHKSHLKSFSIDFERYACMYVFRKMVHEFVRISLSSRGLERRGTLFGADLSKNFGASRVLELFGE